MTSEAKKILQDLKKLQDRQYYFEAGKGNCSQIGYVREFLFDEDFEKKYLQEAADKISAIYEEKIRQKVQELSAEYEPKKLGYSFTWLRKLKSATNDAETEKILQDWLKEISEKKSAEVATE